MSASKDEEKSRVQDKAELLVFYICDFNSNKFRILVNSFKDFVRENGYTLFTGLVRVSSSPDYYFECIALFKGRPEVGDMYRDNKFLSVDIYVVPLREIKV